MKARIIWTKAGHTETHVEGDTLTAIADAEFPGCKGLDLHKTPHTNPDVDVIIVKGPDMTEAGRICVPAGTWKVHGGQPAPKPTPRKRSVVARAVTGSGPAPEAVEDDGTVPGDPGALMVPPKTRKRAAKKVAEPVAVEA